MKNRIAKGQINGIRGLMISSLLCMGLGLIELNAQNPYPDAQFINQPGDGFQGIWYMNQPLGPPYEFKYSGGMGTYCAKHRPFSIYAPEVNKTFFCYGGTRQQSWKSLDTSRGGGDRDTLTGILLHMVSYYDHATHKVARPTILLDKKTRDAHDNPVISLDQEGYIWIFSTAHGTMRRSYIHRSTKPYRIDDFERVEATFQKGDQVVPLDNFSYFQVWHDPKQGFLAFFTHYERDLSLNLGQRVAYYMHSQDGQAWSAWKRLAAISEGHYQISEYHTKSRTAGTILNYHPHQKKPGEAGLNYRTNLYYLQTRNGGETWESADGTQVTLPLTEPRNPALVYDFEQEGLKVYIKDLNYTAEGFPVALFLTSKGYQSGPENGPYTWWIAFWTGTQWEKHFVAHSDHNYDMGSLFVEEHAWRIIAPTDTGAQAYNPGGEMVEWISEDNGKNWKRARTLTQNSPFNHTYARRTVDAHPGFQAFWADGHGRKASPSSFYFSDRAGNVFKLPSQMTQQQQQPQKITP